jgi:hypothetical protein
MWANGAAELNRDSCIVEAQWSAFRLWYVDKKDSTLCSPTSQHYRFHIEK